MCAVCAVIDIEKAMVCNKNQNRTTKKGQWGSEIGSPLRRQSVKVFSSSELTL